MTLSKDNKLTLFYDGQCPLCKAEILFLESRNKNHFLEFVDVSDASYSEKNHSISCEAALEQMHGKFADGKIITGVSVFAAAYERVNLKLLAWIFSRTWLQPFLKIAYQVFAKYRHQISKTIGPTLLKIAQNRFSK
jgi:predicted DCC family thiol-disulfide oxidoreductase YuxK